MTPPDTKLCPRCGVVKPVSEFGPRANRRWLRSWCRPCTATEARAYHHRTNGPDAKARRKARLRVIGLARVGSNPDEYDRLFIEQRGRCAICATDDPGSGRGDREHFSVDHDHRTGMVRGLLCARCNLGIGYFHDNPIVLRAAADYLTDFAYTHIGHDVDGGNAA